MSWRALQITAFLTLVVSPLAACGPALFGGALLGAAHGDTLLAQKTNFREKNFAAADYLYSQAATYIDNRRDLVIAQPLTDTAQVEISSTLGKLIPEQVGIRLSQLGQRVDLATVATTENPNYLKPAMAAGEKPDYLLSGSFTRQRSDVEVSMRITQIATGRIVASFDYTLPQNSDTRALSTPQPKIIRVGDQ